MEASEQSVHHDVSKTTIGCILFLIFWVLITKDSWKYVPYGRAFCSLLCATLFVLTKVSSPEEALESVDVGVLALLTGSMMIAGQLKYIKLPRILRKDKSPLVNLCIVFGVAGLASAILTNDTVCVILPAIIIKEAQSIDMPLEPFLLAVAMGSNAGSSFSPIGNPQNMIISLNSKLSAFQFAVPIFLAAFMSSIIFIVTILLVYRRELYPETVPTIDAPTLDQIDTATIVIEEPGPISPASATTGMTVTLEMSSSAAKPLSEEPSNMPARWSEPNTPTNAPNTTNALDAVHAKATQQAEVISDPVTVSAGDPNSDPVPRASGEPAPLPRLKKQIILALFFALPVCLAVSHLWIGLAWTTLLFGIAMCCVHHTSADAFLGDIDGMLLLFFSGLFICVSGFNQTGIPSDIWRNVGSFPIKSTVDVIIFILWTVVGSNTVGNVPLVLLLSPELQNEGRQELWILLAWVSTIAGNLTLLASVANVIVAEKAKDVSPITFVKYTRVGFPATIVSLLVCTGIVWEISVALLN